MIQSWHSWLLTEICLHTNIIYGYDLLIMGESTVPVNLVAQRQPDCRIPGCSTSSGLWWRPFGHDNVGIPAGCIRRCTKPPVRQWWVEQDSLNVGAVLGKIRPIKPLLVHKFVSLLVDHWQPSTGQVQLSWWIAGENAVGIRPHMRFSRQVSSVHPPGHEYAAYSTGAPGLPKNKFTRQSNGNILLGIAFRRPASTLATSSAW